MGDGMMAGMMAWMLLWGLVGVAVLVLAVLGILRLARPTDHRGLPGRNARALPESPEELLRRRYATGEIDEDEYLRRCAGLA